MKTVETVETVDVKKLKVILSHRDYFKNQMRNSSFEGEYGFSFSQLSKYQSMIRNGEVKVEYKQKNRSGRFFALGGLSLQSFPREIRATIAKDFYYDIDMVNAHPTILKHICESVLNYKPKYLSVYIKNRDKLIKEIIEINPDTTYENIKGCILAIINGGSCLYKTFQKTKWLKEFKNEMKQIHQLFTKKFNKKYEKIKEQRDKDLKSYNYEASLMNHILCNYENEYLQAMVEFLKEKQIITNNYVMCFDGIMVPKSNIEDTDKLLRNLELMLQKDWNINIKLKLKEMQGFDMDDLATTEDTDTKEDIVEQEYFKVMDYYYWIDFMNALKSKTWESLDELKDFCRININRVMLLLATGEIYIKMDSDEPFQHLTELPEYIIKFNESVKTKKGKTIEEELEISFKYLYKKHLINYVKTYNKLALKPLSPDADVVEQNNHSRDFNIWTGFKAKLTSSNSIDHKKIEKILNHIKVVWANNEEHIFKYILSWFHTIFKSPYRKSKVAMVFQSDEQQIGKSIIVEEFLIPFIFGKKLSTVEQGIGFATERFNNRMMGKLFVCCEELNNISDTGNYHTVFDTMKKLITNKTIHIEIKNGAKFEIDDFMNFLLFTNNQFSIKVEDGDARYAIFKCNPIYKKNFKYFNELAATFNQETANHFFSYIYHMDDAVDIRDIPETTIKREIKINCLPSPQRFLYRVKELRDENTDEEHTGWKRGIIDNDELTGAQLYAHYKSYCQEEHERELSQTKFGRYIGTMITKARMKNGFKFQLNNIK